MSKNPVSTKQHVKASFRDACYTSLNIGMVESYFAAFMLALGISDILAGLGTIIPQIIGVVFQLFSIRSFFTQYCLKKRLTLFLTLQSFSMIPLILAGMFKINSPVFVIGMLGLYWASLLSLNPPWNRLMGHTIPERFRLKFFSIRNQFGQVAVFLGLISSGFLLFWARGHQLELPVYVGILCVGFCLKWLSIYEIKSNHIDYQIVPGSEQRLKLRHFLRRLRGTDQGRLIGFLFFFYVAVNFSSPYHAPYMLKKLGLNYLEFMTIVSVSYFGRLLMLRLLQKFAKARHVNTILLFATIGISTSPILWTISQKFMWIVLVEFISGCYWAGFELSTILLYYQKIEDKERTSVITYITFLNTTGMICGSLLGAFFMQILPTTWDSFLTLFALSTFLRLSVVVFAPQVDFKGQIPKLISFNRVMSVRPPFSAFTRPIIGRVRKKNVEEKKD